MLKHFLCILTILAFFMTIPSGTRSDNDVYNEEKVETRYYHYDYADELPPYGLWMVMQNCYDSEDDEKLNTSVSITAAQTDYTHSLYAYASYRQEYADPKIEGTWYLRAQLHHDWATDEEPFEDRGEIRGKEGIMGGQNGTSESGSQSDIDYFANHDPMQTKEKCDAYAEAKVHNPFKDADYRSVSYAHFTPRPINVEWEYEKRP